MCAPGRAHSWSKGPMVGAHLAWERHRREVRVAEAPTLVERGGELGTKMKYHVRW